MERASWKEFPPVKKISTSLVLSGLGTCLPAHPSGFGVSKQCWNAPPSSAVWFECTHWLSCENQVDLSTITLTIFFRNNSLLLSLSPPRLYTSGEHRFYLIGACFPWSPVKCSWERGEGRKRQQSSHHYRSGAWAVLTGSSPGACRGRRTLDTGLLLLWSQIACTLLTCQWKIQTYPDAIGYWIYMILHSWGCRRNQELEKP